MTFYYVEDNFEFEYVVTWEEILNALEEIINVDGGEDIHEYCIRQGFEDEYELSEWFKDDLKDYFEEEALEWYRENR